MLRRLLALLLLLQFAWYTTPKEIWHVLREHTDTEHRQHQAGLQISAEHHHCALMKADQQFHSLPAFTPAFHFEAPPAAPLPKRLARYTSPRGIGEYAAPSLRGPPTA